MCIPPTGVAESLCSPRTNSYGRLILSPLHWRLQYWFNRTVLFVTEKRKIAKTFPKHPTFCIENYMNILTATAQACANIAFTEYWGNP